MKILVTGALGHIGSRLVRDLPFLIPNCEIVMVDNLLTQRYPSLFNLPVEGKYKFIEADITAIDVSALLIGIDVVVHLAAITDAAGSFGNAEEVERNNFIGTKNIANACSLKNVRLITISSASIYGTQEATVDENCKESELKPQSPYALCKYKEEKLVGALVADKGLKAVILRFGTIFGISPGMRFHTAVNKFCWQAMFGAPITVWKTAYNQKRPYLDLQDAIRAIALVIRKDLFDGGIYNVVTANLTVEEVVMVIKNHVGELTINFVDSPIMNQLSYEVLTHKIEAAGFVAAGNLDKCIKETVALFKNKKI